MISHFFIDRPIFASVLSIVISLVGALALAALPIAQYPEITPPTVQVACTYPGASAQVIADTIAAPIEQQVNGVESMLYMSSTSDNMGNYNLIVTFDIGTDLNEALVLVQNRVQLAMPQLPSIVQKQGITIKKKSPSILLLINFFSPDGRYDTLYLSNYATLQCKDELFRLYGVGDIMIMGERDYSIRAWLDPQQLASRDMTATEVVAAVKSQNLPVALGQLGQAPAGKSQVFQPPLSTKGRLMQVDEFANIVVKTVEGDDNSVDAKLVRLRDVARVELGAQQYDKQCSLDNMPSVGLAMYQLPGTNALQVAEGIRAKMEQLKKRFPPGVDYQIAYDTTPYIRESVIDVFYTLRDAIILVAIVVLVFLQNWRATLIPLVAVPVALLGTFAVMLAIGFSLNNISLFGLVLAIGIVVDDAIVVVENVERWLERGLSARDAARKAMEEVTGPVIAVALVLCAVFVPCGFIAGITGQFFRQFALTIAVSTVVSAFNSLTLSPALAAILLKPHSAPRDPLARILDFLFGWFFRAFNAVFSFSTNVYGKIVGLLLRGSIVVLVVYAGLVYLTDWTFNKIPGGFILQQDQGWLLVNVQLPDSASVQRTKQVMNDIEKIALKWPGVAHTATVAGYSVLMSANGSNFGTMFVILDPFDKRRKPELQGRSINIQLMKEFHKVISAANITVFGPPPVPGIGAGSGFKILIEDRGSLGLPYLQSMTDRIVADAKTNPDIFNIFTVFRSNVPQLFLDIDRSKAKSLGVDLGDVFDTLQIQMGSLYINNFNEFGRFWQVNAQADEKFRTRQLNLKLLQARNDKGDMVPLATLMDVKNIVGAPLVIRYNLYQSAPINGVYLPWMSSGEAIELMEGISNRSLPRSMSYEWTELFYLQILAGDTALYVFALAVVFVFLMLAALYESWTLPLAVILVVPMCILCALVGIMIARHPVDIFTQIGFIVLVGLASKNAILIVEFAKARREGGIELREATTEACRLRLRPILMTSFAFILGVYPLVVAEGAGAEMRRTLGAAVFSGMLGVTFFGIFLTPVFFYVVGRFGESKALNGRYGQALSRALLVAINIPLLGLPWMASRLIRKGRR